MVIRTRKRIGILFNFSGSWLGGVYYVQNIIKALNFLEDDEKPEIIIFYKKELSSYALDIDYEYLTSIEWDFSSIYKGYLKSWLFKKNVFIEDILIKHNLDGIYPLYDHPVSYKKSKSKAIIAAWFPDLQHKFYPKYFNSINLILREQRLKLLLTNTKVLVVSSEDVASHFNKFYNLPSTLKVHVLPFVSIIDKFNFNNYLELKEKYNLPNDYFMVSNQFYEHKNHIVLLKALSILKKQNKNVHIVLTGKMEDYRNPNYINQLKKEIETNNIENSISLLGVIPREDQLCLMKNSKAIIQPSLFEGWSTVIEDAKSLQVPVISSNISVHIEQMEKSGIYFDPFNEKELANILASFVNIGKDNLFQSYEDRVKIFAQNFISIFQ